MAKLPNFLVIIRSEKLSGKGQGRGVGVRKKERFVLGKRTFRSQKSKHFVLRIISGQLLFKVQLPLALPTIMAGVNQTIMMALSMVVIAAMISAGGLGEIVLKGITQMKIGLGFEGGIAVVILAIVLDRITQGFVRRK